MQEASNPKQKIASEISFDKSTSKSHLLGSSALKKALCGFQTLAWAKLCIRCRLFVFLLQHPPWLWPRALRGGTRYSTNIKRKVSSLVVVTWDISHFCSQPFSFVTHCLFIFLSVSLSLSLSLCFSFCASCACWAGGRVQSDLPLEGRTPCSYARGSTRFWGLKIANRRFEAIRANRSDVMRIFFVFSANRFARICAWSLWFVYTVKLYTAILSGK